MYFLPKGSSQYLLSGNKIIKVENKKMRKLNENESYLDFILVDHYDYSEGRLIYNLESECLEKAEGYSTNCKRVVMASSEEHFKERGVDEMPSTFIDIFVTRFNNQHGEKRA